MVFKYQIYSLYGVLRFSSKNNSYFFHNGLKYSQIDRGEDHTLVYGSIGKESKEKGANHTTHALTCIFLMFLVFLF